STTLTLSAHAHCPVVAVRGRDRPDAPVVVGVDGSELSNLALGCAFAQAARRDVPLVAVHAYYHADSHRPDQREQPELVELAERLAEPVGRPLPAGGGRAGGRGRAAARVPAEAERGRQRVGGGQPRTRGFHRPAGRLDEPRDAALRRVPGHGGATPARLTTHAARSPIPARTVGPSGYCRGMDVILVPGFWLDASSWDAVLPALRPAGHRPHPMTLPGLESREADRSGITLRDHVAAV